ncbi:sensory box protein [Collimonas fungivorans]|uniref:Sensory box protein n=1 Tax=Collimonas fungivorans TaxID=158899 RepID=A0A127PF30_9BURK|nr:sigma 54-interacting transcriptional regulator [Collimonas fungivorans]AMO96031.1 sensory box protein [Collimonas fungivorans]
MDTELASALAIFSQLFDAMPQPVAVIDNQGNYVYYNQESAKIDAYPAERAVGHPLLDIYPAMDAESSTLLQALHHGKRYTGAFQAFVNAQGRLVQQIHTTLPLLNRRGAVVGAVEIARDLAAAGTDSGTSAIATGKQEANQHGIVSQDPAMQVLIRQAEALGKAGVNVLLCGETGTGKELFARLLHQSSQRAGAPSPSPFVVLNCAAIPETLFESTLFGTARGAFTGAQERQGLIETANSGTLFLDELNSLPWSVQGKLLRVLQDGMFSRVGSNKEIRADLRVIAAANETQQEMVEGRKLRPDLLYRLNIGQLSIPPLRERRGDIPLLAEAFLHKHRGVAGGRVKRIAPAAMRQLQACRWPGNVRMLENVMQRSLIFCETGDELQAIWIGEDAADTRPGHGAPAEPAPDAQSQGSVLSLEEQISSYEKTLLIGLLKEHASLSEVARRCAIPRATLQYKLKKHNITLHRSAS